MKVHFSPPFLVLSWSAEILSMIRSKLKIEGPHNHHSITSKIDIKTSVVQFGNSTLKSVVMNDNQKTKS